MLHVFYKILALSQTQASGSQNQRISFRSMHPWQITSEILSRSTEKRNRIHPLPGYKRRKEKWLPEVNYKNGNIEKNTFTANMIIVAPAMLPGKDTKTLTEIKRLPAKKPSGIFFTSRAHRIGL